jgi:predicted ATPase
MVWVVGVILEDQRLLINDGMAFLADVLPKTSGFLTIMTGATQVSKWDKTRIYNLKSFLIIKRNMLPYL